jgi:thiamine biosynthesis protein ThiI
MEYKFILLRYGEIFLKGQNKSFFEKKLFNNIKILTGVNHFDNVRGRIIIEYFPEHHLLKRVFGLVSYSPAIKVEKDIEAIKKGVIELLKDKKGTFKVETKRADKNFPITSPEANVLLGKHIETHTKLKFGGDKSNIIVGVEINQEGAYLFSETICCHGGLPTGIEGRVGVLVENESDLLSALLMMKRGCGIIVFGFKEKNISLLQKHSPIKLNFNLVKSFEEIEEKCSEYKINILVCGQTFGEYKKLDTPLTILRPLIAYSKEEVNKELQSYDE